MSIASLGALDEIVARVEYPGHRFVRGFMGDGYYIQIAYNEPDIETGILEEQRGRKWYVSIHATESEVFQTALKAALTSAEHRVREHFLVDDTRVFGPHLDIDEMVKFVKEKEEKRRW